MPVCRARVCICVCDCLRTSVCIDALILARMAMLAASAAKTQLRLKTEMRPSRRLDGCKCSCRRGQRPTMTSWHGTNKSHKEPPPPSPSPPPGQGYKLHLECRWRRAGGVGAGSGTWGSTGLCKLVNSSQLLISSLSSFPLSPFRSPLLSS